ncbi:MAG TPA: CPBP family intramembrane metalloprotease [Hellea balneolensis]|uniref:CPBP family intramembrane metalloprotease n=1 Tax=Hellea balneolensis TaxID=287478 RepID=A0A7C5LTL6_9PROT|nr:CPBP family intramembrane metalloprotease [Hellea balneolensis]
MSTITPIRAFFAQTEIGESRWWSWLAVIWFAITLWFYGQIIVGIPLFIAGLAADPDGLDKLMEMTAQSQAQSDSLVSLATKAAFLLPVLVMILWFVRNQFSETSKPSMMKIAGGLAAISFVCLIYVSIKGSDPAQMEVINGWIAKSPIVYALMLLMFPPMAIGLWLGQKYIHKRTILSLHTAAKRFRWGRLLFAMVSLWVIAGGFSWLGHVSGISPVKFVFDPSRFWMYLPITLLLIPLQSATEEIMLRGYLNQGLGHYIKNPWVVFFITSAGFAALHLGNPEIAEATKDTPLILALSGYFFFGFFACILTYIDGGLESAIGMHAANNIFAASVIGYDNSALPIPTVFHVQLDTVVDSLSVLVMLSTLCVLMFLTRRPVEIR